MNPEVIAVISDLFFATKVESTARAVNVDLLTVPTSRSLRAALAKGPAKLVVVDMALANDEALSAIQAAGEQETPPKVVAFYSHVETDLARQAHDAGADEVMPRSAFSANLPTILQNAR